MHCLPLLGRGVFFGLLLMLCVASDVTTASRFQVDTGTPLSVQGL